MIAIVRAPRRFEIGQLITHRRYGYRGVIVAYDSSCQAPDSWYRSNQTQPDRQQPWYHVLVHGSPVTTYAAQTSLEADDSGLPIEHPLAFDREMLIHELTPSRNGILVKLLLKPQHPIIEVWRSNISHSTLC
jgi:heat shock protein HspQ